MKGWFVFLKIGGGKKMGECYMDYSQTFHMILGECEESLESVRKEDVELLVNEILRARKVFFIGVGRVMLSLEAMAKRLAHCGIDTVCVGQITEPAITPDDVLIAASGSGESLITVGIARKAKSLGVRVVMIGSNPDSTLAGLADLLVRIPVRTKLNRADEISSEQPMTSLFEQTLLLFGDTVAKLIIEKMNLDMDGLWKCHANLE